MPPRRGIVKSGNAGNSSKAAKQTIQVSDGEKPLFPPGFKYPLSLLHENSRHPIGWEKPSVDTRQVGDSWSFAVHLSRINKKTNERETVRLEPKPSYLMPSSIEARHWGATYALYRFCNGMQLQVVLPPGPKEYWNQLAAEHKNAPSHLKWLYDPDPFAAKAVKEKERDVAVAPVGSRRPLTGPIFDEFSQIPEVKMAVSLKESVEEAIKKGLAQYPEASDVAPTVFTAENISKVTQQLAHLGFTPGQGKKAAQFLSQPSPLASALLDLLPELEACIEYLILYTPECDLPQRFIPSRNSSNPFVMSAHSGTEDLKRRWVEDTAVKAAGWPPHAVKRCIDSNPSLLQHWDRLTISLGHQLLGEEWNSDRVPGTLPYDLDPDELEALGITIRSDKLIMPLFSAPIEVHILTTPEKSYPRPGHSPIYLTSASVPPYIRLHLLSQLLVALKSDDFIEAGEGFCMAVMRFLEGEWAKIEDNGPPDMSAVLRHIVPAQQAPMNDENACQPSKLHKHIGGRRQNFSAFDRRNDEEIKAKFQALRQTEGYLKMLAIREKLPAFAAKEIFLQQLENHRVVVVVGETGSGKTTQLPQFILDSLITSGRGSKASILVTQPRRISAISVAARVSAERLDDGSVGFAIRGESKRDSKTKLLFCTTGVVLRRLGSGDELKDVSHVMVDEVHERSVDGDLLLIQLKELLKKHVHLKVILMSATINHETFIKYFDGAPLLTISGRTHPVTDRYLEDVIPNIDYKPSSSKSRKHKDSKSQAEWYQSLGLDEASISIIETITSSDKTDFQLIAAVVDYIISTAQSRSGILIFLPGIQEIRQCIDAIRATISDKTADIFPLHANLSSEEQGRVFWKTSNWKIIAATNVAETSLTIDGITYVLDTGKVKENQYDPDTGLSRLEETWVTRAAAQQRRGRAGRMQPGMCYKLYTRKLEAEMGKFPVPEILRVPLESVLLTVKVTREKEDVKLFLNKAIDPPKIEAVEKSWSILRELGAVDSQDKLTPLGRHLAMLPVDLRLGKMLIFGAIFQCLGPILTIAAILSSKPLFLSPMDKREEANQARSRFATGGSDLLTDLKAYDDCTRLGLEGKTQSEIRRFCEENFIAVTTLREITILRVEFLHALSGLGFIPLSFSASSPVLIKNSANTNLLKAVVLGGFWPRVARVHLPKFAIKFDKVQAGTIRRENTAREFRFYDMKKERVFLHPASVLFGEADWKNPFLVYFHKYMSSKVFLRDATEVPLYGLLLFGGPVSVDHIKGGLTVGSKDCFIELKASPRIGILVNQLRRLLDAQLERCVEDGSILSDGCSPVLNAMLSLLTRDGMSL